MSTHLSKFQIDERLLHVNTSVSDSSHVFSFAKKITREVHLILGNTNLIYENLLK